MIDIKELRIGSHISLKGERVAVFQTLYTGLVEILRPNKEFELCTPADELDPIPLTAELLQELGFEKELEYGEISFWRKDNLYMRIRGERMEFSVDCERTMSVYNIKYLHELEAFVYLTTKQELIKEE